MTIFIRWCLIVAATALLAGCANESGSVLTGLTPISPAQASGFAGNDTQDPSKRTLASKMLTAIALERITGRKPDPSRLAELY